MSIKIKKDGQVREFILPATNIQVLDMADKFKKKDLENVIKEISDTEHIYVGEVDETKDGIWIDDGDTLDNAENNGVVERIKEYVDGQIKDYSNPNLLVNGDFQIWSNGESFTQNGVFTADKWKTYRSNQTISKCAENTLRILKTSSSGATGITQEFENYTMFNGKEATFSFKAKASVDNHTIFVRVGETVESMDLNTSNQKYSFTIDSLDFTTAQHSINIGSSNANVGEYIELQEIKLELGCKATPFVPKKYHEELLACNDGIIGSNSNLLINADFRNPVNQRGKTQYTSNEYCVDRWKKWNGAFTTTVKDGFLRNSGSYITLIQYIENCEKIFKNLTTFTMSARVRCDKERAVKFSYYDHVNNRTIAPLCPDIIVGTKWQTISFTTTVNVDNIGYQTAFCIETGWNDDPTAVLDIEWIKLEIGSVVTPFQPKPYSQELRDCQRYYCTEDWSSANVPRVLYKVSEDYQDRGLICFPTEMRITPTINLVWGDNVINNSSYVAHKGIDTLTSKSFVPYVNRSSAGINNKQFVPSVKSYTADAEIY